MNQKLSFNEQGYHFIFDADDTDFADEYKDFTTYDITPELDLESKLGIVRDEETGLPRMRTQLEFDTIYADQNKINMALIWDHIRLRQGDEKWLMDQDGLDKIKTLYKQDRQYNQGLRTHRDFHDADGKLVWRLRNEYLLNQIEDIDKVVKHIEFFDTEGNIAFASNDNANGLKVPLSPAAKSKLKISARETSVSVLVQKADAKRELAMLAVQAGGDPNDEDIKRAIGFGQIVDAVYSLISPVLPIYYLRGQGIAQKVIADVMVQPSHPVYPALISDTGYDKPDGSPVLVGEYLISQFYPK